MNYSQIDIENKNSEQNEKGNRGSTTSHQLHYMLMETNTSWNLSLCMKCHLILISGLSDLHLWLSGPPSENILIWLFSVNEMSSFFFFHLSSLCDSCLKHTSPWCTSDCPNTFPCALHWSATTALVPKTGHQYTWVMNICKNLMLLYSLKTTSVSGLLRLFYFKAEKKKHMIVFWFKK